MQSVSFTMSRLAKLLKLSFLLVSAFHAVDVFAAHTERLDSSIQESEFGYATVTGDFNGDGYSDLAVGMPSYGLHTGGFTTDGRVYVYYGGPSGFQATPDWTADSNQVGAGTYFGAAVANVGDVNGDGIDDLAIGEPGGSSYTGAGHVYIYFGNSSGLKASGSMAVPSDADITLTVSAGGTNRFGAAIAGGDINHDGCSDVVVGAYGYDDTTTNRGGAVFAYRTTNSGSCSLPTTPSETLVSTQLGASFGKSVALVTGIKGGTYPDLLVGANGFDNAKADAGAAYVYYGSATPYASSPDWTFEGDLASGAVGTTVASAGDVNKDNYTDVIIGAYNYNNAGAAFIFYGSSTGLKGSGTVAPTDADWHVYGSGSEKLGDSVAGIGDINGDGVDDVIAGGDFYNNPANPSYSNEGYAAIYYGSSPSGPSTIADWSYTPSGQEADVAHYGGWVQQGGDIDGDGKKDYVVSAYAFSTSLANGTSSSPLHEGAVFVYLSGPAPALVVTPTSGLTTTEAGGTATFTVALAGEPGADVTVHVATSNPYEGTVSAGASLNNMIFTRSNWSTPQTVTITGQHDFVVDGPTAYSISLTTASSDINYNGLSTTPVSVTNTDIDVAGVTVSPASLVTEFGATASFNIALATKPSASVTIPISSSDTNQGTVSISSVTFTSVNWNTPYTITVTGANPKPANNAYSVVLGPASSGDSHYNGLDPADVSVVNRVSTVTITSSTPYAAEPVTPGAFTVTRDGNTSFALNVNYAVDGSSTATSGVDYTALSGAVTIPMGQSSATITVEPINDSIIELDETVVTTIAAGSDYVADPNSATVTIIDDDSLPEASFSADQTVVVGSVATVTVTLNKTSVTYPVVVPYTVSGTATYPSDHNAQNGSVVISSYGKSGSLSFQTVSHNTAQGDKTVIFTMGTPTNATVGTPSSTVVTIADSGGASGGGGGGGGAMGVVLWLALLLKRGLNGRSMLISRLRLLGLMAVAGLALSACGGGGGGAALPTLGSGGPTGEAIYAVRGTVSGLSGTVILRNSFGITTDDVTVTSNGGFTFTKNLQTGQSYEVTVTSDPTGQTCYVGNASGTVNKASVTNVSVNCQNNLSATTYNISGAISGLSGTIVLQNNGGDDLTLTTGASGFTFASGVVDGSDYRVSVSTPPAGQTCAVINGTGTVSGADVNTVSVSCNATLGTQTASMVVAGYKHTCALLGNGKVKCWGSNHTLGSTRASDPAGELGLGDTLDRGRDPNDMGDNLPAVDLGAGRTAVAIAAGAYHTCAILNTDGAVKCWGSNYFGQLGQTINTSNYNLGDAPGEMGDSLPTVDLGTGGKAIQITAGYEDSCALLQDGSIRCWGNNFFGEAGGSGKVLGTSRAVNLGSNTAIAVSEGDTHTCALLSDHTVMCWGANNFGQLGQGLNSTDLPSSNTPLAVDLGSGVLVNEIAAGTSFTCALLSSGSVKCWGGNYDGQLGLGDQLNRGDAPNQMGSNLPAVDLGTGRTALHIAAGQQSACAILDNSSVKCWGYNIFGELGQGDTLSRGDAANEMGDNLAAVNLGSGRTATSIAVGQAESLLSAADGTHTCAILDNGSLKCWGWNASGQLGIIDAYNDYALGNNPGEMGDTLQPVNLGN